MSLIFPAISFKQRSTKMYIAIVRLSDLEYFSIDLLNPQNIAGRNGYQRNLDERRIKKIAAFFERSSAIMPVAGLLNVREKDRLKFTKNRVVIPDGTKVWVVDMQHRLKGLLLAHEQRILKDNSFGFPVVITEGLSQVDEAIQFYIINTKAKKMDVALTRRLLIANNKVREIVDTKPWEIPAVQVTMALNRSLPVNPWYGRIRQPNEEKQPLHIATEKSFVQSLRQILIPGRLKHPRRVARRLAEFWKAIKEVIPEAFDDPKAYIIQKTPGMFAFNSFIAPIFLARYKDREFSGKLAGLKKLGPKFWRGRNKQGAKRFGTGMAGYALLADHIKKQIG
jgi:DGQHR domain-containing protein